MLKQIKRRHTLLSMSEAGKRQAAASAQPKDAERLNILWERYPQVPVICARQSGRAPEGWLEGGISFPERDREARIRFALMVPESEILNAVTPWQIFSSFVEERTALAREKTLLKRMEGEDIKIGIFGSMALEQYTGLPYVHDASDFDLVIKARGREALNRFWSEIKTAGMAADVELLLKSGWYVKAAELFSGSATVLAKSECEAALLSSREVWETIENTDNIDE